MDAFLDEFDGGEEGIGDFNGWTSLAESIPNSLNAGCTRASCGAKVQCKSSKRTRVRPKAELAQLRKEEYELSRKLHTLRLEARPKILIRKSSRLKHSAEHTRKQLLLYWERAASRQAQRRQQSEQENCRLREKLQIYLRHTRQIQQAIPRQLLRLVCAV